MFKKLFKITALTASFIAASAFSSVSVFASDDDTVVLGTASITGKYHLLGKTIKDLVEDADAPVRLDVRSSGGSVFNIKAIRQGEFDVAIAQSDWQFHGYNGSSKFESDGAFKDLRALFSAHGEAFALVVSPASGIKTLDDLKGKRFNLGNPGSGSRSTTDALLSALGWNRTVFSTISELTPKEMSSYLCDGNSDAFTYVIGHPAGTIEEAVATCQAVLIDVNGPAVDGLIASAPYYSKAVIPGGTYGNNPEDIETFALKATVITSAALGDDQAYHIVKSVFENLDELIETDRAFSQLDKAEMVKAGLSVPLHPGALKYYKEAGLIK